jgi:hypothetical protein
MVVVMAMVVVMVVVRVVVTVMVFTEVCGSEVSGTTRKFFQIAV